MADRGIGNRHPLIPIVLTAHSARDRRDGTPMVRPLIQIMLTSP
jgi:hypothetical protein